MKTQEAVASPPPDDQALEALRKSKTPREVIRNVIGALECSGRHTDAARWLRRNVLGEGAQRERASILIHKIDDTFLWRAGTRSGSAGDPLSTIFYAGWHLEGDFHREFEHACGVSIELDSSVRRDIMHLLHPDLETARASLLLLQQRVDELTQGLSLEEDG